MESADNSIDTLIEEISVNTFNVSKFQYMTTGTLNYSEKGMIGRNMLWNEE